MLTALTILVLVSGQISDAPRKATLTTRVKGAPEWVAPSLVAMTVFGGGPLTVTLGLATYAALAGTTASVASLMVSAILGLMGATMVGAIMIGLALEDAAHKGGVRRIAVWPWITSAIATLLVGGMALGAGVIAFGGWLAALNFFLMVPVVGGLTFLVLLGIGITTAISNAERKPRPAVPCSPDPLTECRGVNVFAF